jgi:hypothetical protein
MTTIKHKRGAGVPSPDDLEVGEIAIDTSTGTAYTKTSDGDIVPVVGDPEWAKVGKAEADDGNQSVYLGYTDKSNPFYTQAAVAVGFNATAGFGGVGIGHDCQGGMVGVAVGAEAKSSDNATAIGTQTKALNTLSIALGHGAETTMAYEFAISPHIQHVNFSQATVQAADYLDADGNSIFSNFMSLNSTNQCRAEEWGVIGEGFELRTNGIITNRFFKNLYSEVYDVASTADPDNPQLRMTAGAAKFDCTVQATDFLDEDGNSIIGTGGGGGVEFPTEDNGYAWVATPEGWKEVDGYHQTEYLFKNHNGAMIWEGKKGYLNNAYDYSLCAGRENQASARYDILIGNKNMDMGPEKVGYNILIGTGNSCVMVDGAIAIGKDHFIMPGDEGTQIGFALGEGNTVQGDGIAIGKNVSAGRGQVVIGDKQISFADDLVEAFTALQAAIAKEDNAEDAIATLTDTLGDLIRKFKQKARVEPLQRMSAEEAEAAGQSARARLDA